MWSVFGPRWKVGRAGGRGHTERNTLWPGRRIRRDTPTPEKPCSAYRPWGAMPCGSQPERTGAVPHLYRRSRIDRNPRLVQSSVAYYCYRSSEAIFRSPILPIKRFPGLGSRVRKGSSGKPVARS